MTIKYKQNTRKQMAKVKLSISMLVNIDGFYSSIKVKVF